MLRAFVTAFACSSSSFSFSASESETVRNSHLEEGSLTQGIALAPWQGGHRIPDDPGDGGLGLVPEGGHPHPPHSLWKQARNETKCCTFSRHWWDLIWNSSLDPVMRHFPWTVNRCNQSCSHHQRLSVSNYSWKWILAGCKTALQITNSCQKSWSKTGYKWFVSF